MRMIGLLFAALIGLGIYYYFLKQAAPAPGQVVTQAISTTGVEMDLNAIAQAERMYFAQNGSYGDLGQLTSSGALTMSRSGRDGYDIFRRNFGQWFQCDRASPGYSCEQRSGASALPHDFRRSIHANPPGVIGPRVPSAVSLTVLVRGVAWGTSPRYSKTARSRVLKSAHRWMLTFSAWCTCKL